MIDAELAEWSRRLFTVVAMPVLTVGMIAYLYAMAFSRVGVASEAESQQRAVKARWLGTGLTILGTGTLLAHMVVHGIASNRLPLGNMFEFSTVMAVTALVGGLVVVQWRMQRADIMGFVVLGAILTMGGALLVYTDPGPIMPILDTWWRAIHVSTISLAAGIFTVGFVFTGLYLVRDTAERRLAATATDTKEGALVGAGGGEVTYEEGTIDGRTSPDVTTGSDPADAPADVAARRREMRDTINPWTLAGVVWIATAALSWVFWVDAGVSHFLLVNTAVAGAAVLAWWFVPYLPSASTLDTLTYRTIAFGFPLWTFAVLTGAIWAEQSWGRFWGWDPKETSAFVTWIAYAGYLHARATRGMKGRMAGWVAVLAFAVLMFTYYIVNLVVVGLHSYA